MADDQGVSVCRRERMKQALNGVCGDGRRGGGDLNKIALVLKARCRGEARRYSPNRFHRNKS